MGRIPTYRAAFYLIQGQYSVMGEREYGHIHHAKHEIYHSCRMKSYPLGGYELMACSRPVFRERGFEAAERKGEAERGAFPAVALPAAQQQEQQDSAASREATDTERARRRAAAAVRDLVLSNEFSYFVTLTLDQTKIERYDMKEITRKLNVWLDNCVRRYGLVYVLVPEHHKDGAVHFHGFFNDALPVVDSGHADGRGHSVFNLPRWTFGFSTAIKLYGEYASACAYVCKYVRKQTEKIGGRWFYSGGKLKKPTITFPTFDLRDVQEMGGSYSFEVQEAGLFFALYRDPCCGKKGTPIKEGDF